METETNRQDQPAQPERKRSYTKPEIVEYGSVRELTRGGSGTEAEGRTGGRRFNL